VEDRQAFRIIKDGTANVNGKGRILFVADILELIRNAKSSWWVRNSFAPEHRFKVGRSPAWWEGDALNWLNGQRAK
jgi:hypothetical protein